MSAGSNWNVRLALVTSVVVGTADSVWNGTIMATYLYDLGNKSNTFVGLVEMAMGTCQLVVALPVGLFADSKDKLGRTRKVLATKLGAPAMVVSAALTCAVVWLLSFGHESVSEDRVLKYGLVGIMMLWGVTETLVMGPFQAVFADSLPTGERSKYYALLYAGYIGASALGPLLSIGLFLAWGNAWSARRLAKVLFVGMVLEVVAAPLFLGFKRSALLGAEADEAGGQSPPPPSPEEDEEEIETTSNKKKQVPLTVTVFGRELATSTVVPWTLFVASLLSSLGSGSTVKFFPLYFKETVGLSPIQVQIIYAVVPLAMVAGMAAVQSLHPACGRVQTLILAKLVAVGLLVVMIVLSHTQFAHNAWILVPVYVVRTALANCTYPIEESILMDFARRDQRARWKSVESIASFGWCGSALVGGIISDRYAYATTFAATACLQFASAMILLLLVPIIPVKEHDLSLISRGDALATLDDHTLSFARSSDDAGLPVSTTAANRVVGGGLDENASADLHVPLLLDNQNHNTSASSRR